MSAPLPAPVGSHVGDGPYVDPNITSGAPFSNTPWSDGPDTPTDDSPTKPYDTAGTEYSSFTSTPALASEPLPWAVGRDPYANGGMAGQAFFDNAG